MPSRARAPCERTDGKLVGKLHPQLAATDSSRILQAMRIEHTCIQSFRRLQLSGNQLGTEQPHVVQSGAIVFDCKAKRLWPEAWIGRPSRHQESWIVDCDSAHL